MISRPIQRPSIVIVDSAMTLTGALRCASRLARLIAPWADTLLVLPHGSVVPERDTEAFSDVVHLPLVQVRKSTKNLVLYLPALVAAGWRLRRLLADKSASVLVLNDFYMAQGAIVRALGFRGRIVTWVRFDPRNFPTILSKVWLASAYRSSNAIVAVSDFILELLPPSPKLRRIYDCIDVDLAAARLATVPVETQDVIFIANYIDGKGQIEGIDAFAKIASAFPDARLIFHGHDMGLTKNAEYKCMLERRAAAAGLTDRIFFRPFAIDLPIVMSEAAVALVLSKSESFSLTCLEASQLGVPVIAFRSGGPAEIVDDGVTGFLFDVGDVAGVSQALTRLLGDPALGRRMGAAGAAHVEDKFGPAGFIAAIRPLLGV